MKNCVITIENLKKLKKLLCGIYASIQPYEQKISLNRGKNNAIAHELKKNLEL